MTGGVCRKHPRIVREEPYNLRGGGLGRRTSRCEIENVLGWSRGSVRGTGVQGGGWGPALMGGPFPVMGV